MPDLHSGGLGFKSPPVHLFLEMELVLGSFRSMKFGSIGSIFEALKILFIYAKDCLWYSNFSLLSTEPK